MDIIISLSFVALAIAVLTVAAPLHSLIKQWRSGKPRDRFYEDVDGTATPETIAEFSNKGIKTILLLFSIAGISSSVGYLTLVCLHKVSHGWVLQSSLHTASWAVIVVHSACIIAHHSPVRCHDLGVMLTLCTSFFSIPIILQLTHAVAHKNKYSSITTSLLTLNAAAVLGLVVTGSLFPRRPAVFFGKHEVDQQWTTSALSRFTWTWIEPLLQHAYLHNDVAIEDLPVADMESRSQTLADQWNKLNKGTSLFRSLLRAYRRKFIILWLVTAVRCVVSIVPFWFMLRILNLLENPTAKPLSTELLVLISFMAISNLLDSWMEGWLYWYSMESMALPIRTQLCALIFNKALRRKNVQAVAQQDHTTESGDDAQSSSEEAGGYESDQSVINLVGVDTERICTCLQYHFMILNGVVKLFIFSAFLLQLLGWIPFVAGISAWALTLPANAWFSGRVLRQSRRLMKLRDTRLSKINEMLLGMRHIKFSALELQWENRILALRNLELKALWKFLLADSGLFACWTVSPILLAVASLSAYVFVVGSLLPSITFVSIGLFNSLETTLGSLPELFTLYLDSLVSLRRIDGYLLQKERQNMLVDGPVISFESATVGWPVDESNSPATGFVLRDIDLSFPPGSLSVICGKVGTGKTLLLSAILGDSEIHDGTISVPAAQDPQETTGYSKEWIVPGSVAYVSQVPWLESTSFRNNILFGLPFKKKRYDSVLTACALREDLAALPDYDETEIGAEGINLSGGQKWRISLARAVYSRAETLLMEDIFSAVDTRVGAHIYEKCLTGDICKDRTRILATHHLSLVMPQTTFLVELGENRVLYAGPPHGRAGYEELDWEGSDTDIADPEIDDSAAHVSLPHQNNGSEEQKPNEGSKVAKKFMQEEVREKGSVKGRIYLAYIKSSSSLLFWVASICMYLTYQLAIIGRAWWLRIWTRQATIECTDDCMKSNFRSLSFSDRGMMHTIFVADALESDHELFYYLNIYIAISVGAAVIGVLRYMSSYLLSIRASKALFQNMLFTVMHVPLRWLDTVPKGQVLNRFTADYNIIDERLMMSYCLFISNLLRSAGICIASCFASAYLVLPGVLLLGIGTFIGNKYLVASRPLKRLESNARSPVFELFQTTLMGISTIRAYQRVDAYFAQMHRNLDAWSTTSFYIALANRWMSFRMALLATLFTIVVGLVITFKLNDAALAGLVLSFVLDFSESLRWTIRCYGDMELEMNAMERISEYTSLEMESLEGSAPPAAWPTTGAIEFVDLQVAYAPDLSPVLKGLSFKVEHRQKIGVVGRTGAGKSSMTLALFRLLEARSGSIRIDDVDISKISLKALRTQLSIIPQQPVLYSGTIRSNLDPFDLHTDYELYDALSRIHVEDSPCTDAESSSTSTETSPLRDLFYPVSESGSNLSQGQQQLLCIARALLTKSKIVVLDEATSAIDRETDNLIQHNMLNWFTERTLIVIAHRLSTVANFDKILVLDDGCLVEYDTPKALWEKKGVFRSMCDRTGEKERESLRKTILEELI